MHTELGFQVLCHLSLFKQHSVGTEFETETEENNDLKVITISVSVASMSLLEPGQLSDW